MFVYARIVVFGPLALSGLYLALSVAFSARDRRAERQAGR